MKKVFCIEYNHHIEGFSLEFKKKAFDIATTCTSPYPDSIVYIHEPKVRVDMTKFIDTSRFIFDHSFDETTTNAQVYDATVKPLVLGLFKGRMCTFFAYGQTGIFNIYIYFNHN